MEIALKLKIENHDLQLFVKVFLQQ
jgi:hypothetical protein